MKYQIVISVDDAGRVNVQGTIQNQLIAYGMLEVGRNAINEYHQKLAEQRIQPANPADVAALIKPGS